MARIKDRRLEVLRQLMEKGDIRTQSELKEKLRQKGITISQATISRVLREFGFARVPVGDGTLRLVKVEGRNEHIDLLLRLGLEEMLAVGNLILIKTRPGNAQAIAGAIDRSRIRGILGTIGGDDTILAVTRSPSTAREVVANLKKMLR